MSTTRRKLESMSSNLNESIGARPTELHPKISPVAFKRDVGRRSNRSFGQIAIERVQPDPSQPRIEFDEESIEQLSASIKEKGQLAPIRVRWSEEHGVWLIISGERRWRACQRAGLTSIDCNFEERELSPNAVLEEQLIENLLRVDLRPVEEAESFEKLMLANDWNGKQLATALNISPTRVSRALALLELPPEIRAQVDAGQISARAGYELSRVPESARQPLTNKSKLRAKDIREATSRKQPIQSRGCNLTFIADSGWRIVAKSDRKGTYHDVEQALVEALEEVRLRINNRVKLL